MAATMAFAALLVVVLAQLASAREMAVAQSAEEIVCLGSHTEAVPTFENAKYMTIGWINGQASKGAICASKLSFVQISKGQFTPLASSELPFKWDSGLWNVSLDNPLLEFDSAKKLPAGSEEDCEYASLKSAHAFFSQLNASSAADSAFKAVIIFESHPHGANQMSYVLYKAHGNGKVSFHLFESHYISSSSSSVEEARRFLTAIQKDYGSPPPCTCFRKNPPPPKRECNSSLPTYPSCLYCCTGCGTC